MTETQQVRAGIRALRDRLEQHLAGEYRLTEEEFRLASDIALWYQGYQCGLAAAQKA